MTPALSARTGATAFRKTIHSSSIAGARPEVWAYGLRNPHRLNWDADRANPANNHLIAAVIGWNTWETVVIVQKGANYGYPEREGTEMIEGRQDD